MSYFPFYVELSGEECLVIGGGAVAARKVQTLQDFGGHIKIISPEICDELKNVVRYASNITYTNKCFEPSDICKPIMVIAATDKREVNHKVSCICHEKNIYVNVADCKEECSFIFPSIVKREDIVIGISTSGESPDVSKYIRKHLQEEVPDFLPELSRNLGKYRHIVMEHVKEVDTRKKVFRELLHTGLKNQGVINDNMVEKIISKYE